MCSIDFLSKSSKQVPKITPECKRKWSYCGFRAIQCHTQVRSSIWSMLQSFTPCLGFTSVRDKLASNANNGANPARLRKPPELIESPSQLKALQS